MSELDAESALLAVLARHAERGLTRVEFEVRGERVVLFARGERLVRQCTCGEPGCEHIATALHFLGDTGAPELRARSSMRPPPPAPSADLASLGTAFEELILGVVRAGIASPDSPSIRQPLEQLVARAGSPTPLGLVRWVARLNDALGAGDAGEVARLIDGARLVADELVSGERSQAALSRRRAWLGSGEGAAHESLTDATLVEVARERLAGLTRAAVERRYLLDLASGEVFKEERRTSDHELSVGPCPRVVHVAFAELESGSVPRRVRLLQYTISALPAAEQWQRVAEHAARSVRELSVRYGDAVRTAPGQAEPFVLFAPRPLGDVPAPVLLDDEGDPLLLADEPESSFAQVLHAAGAGGEVLWVSGRLLGLARGLVLRPLSLLVRRDSQLHLCRIT